MLDETDNERIRREHAMLVLEKAKAEADWHQEVRVTLKSHGDSLVAIKQNVGELAKSGAHYDALEARVKTLEDFKLQAMAYWTAASGLVIILWKVLDKFWQ